MTRMVTSLLYVGEIKRYVLHEAGQAPKIATIDFDAMKGVREPLNDDQLKAYLRARREANKHR